MPPSDEGPAAAVQLSALDLTLSVAAGPPPARIGPYRLRGCLGRGGTGEVFLAVHERLQQQVALKLLSDAVASDKQVVSRFLQEGLALARVQHPGVVRVLDCDRLNDGRVYLAMEYLEGRTLRSWMNAQTSGIPEKLRIVSRIAEIMAVVHERGIVHRDLKPENIFVCDDPTGDAPGRIKILDFGLAKVPLSGAPLLDTQVRTASPGILGTVKYMAPEQCCNPADVDDRADVYALGTLLWELLTGRIPFPSQDPVEMLSMRLSADPPHLCRQIQELPPDLGSFIMSMLSRQPRERPSMVRCNQVLGRRWRNELGECPLPGLAPLSETHAELLFGRSGELDHLLAQCEEMRAGGLRWLQLEGASDVGKSSLVQAGLLPRLRLDGAPSTSRWRIADFRPSGIPLMNLARALLLAMELDMDLEDLERALRSGAEGLTEVVRRRLEPGVLLLIVIDSVEDLFTLPSTESDALALDALLARALDDPDGRCRLLTVVRSDMLLQAAAVPLMVRAAAHAKRYPVHAMSAELICQAISAMARLVGMQLAEGLAERMVRDGTGVGCGLSLLGHTLRRLWITGREDLVSYELYESLGGVGGALAREAEQALEVLSDEGRDRAKWILLGLVKVGRGASDIRRPRTRREVVAAAGNDSVAEKVLNHLAGVHTGIGALMPTVRFLVVSDAPDSGEPRVELVHEAMLRNIQTLHGWIEQERLLLERQQDLEGLAAVWEQTGAPTDGLPTGSLLAHYCRQEHLSLLSVRARQFITIARRFDARRNRLRRIAIGVAALAGAAVLISALFARQEQARAENSLQQILATTEGIVSDLDWKLSRLPHTLPVRREMLHLVHRSLLELSSHDENDPSVSSALIRATHRLADVAWMNGTLTEATQLLAEAGTAIRRARESWPSEPAFIKLFALNRSKRGKVSLAKGLQGDALADFQEAVVVFERLALVNQDPDTRRSLAISYQELAEAEIAGGATGLAESLLEKASVQLQENSGEYDRSLLTLVRCERSLLAMTVGEWALPQQILLQELRVQTSLLAASEPNGFHRWVRARVRTGLAELYLERGQYDEAEMNARVAQALAEQLHTEEPSNKRYALSMLQGAEISEAIASVRQDPEAATKIRHRRCAIAARFSDADPQDVRFRPPSCLSKKSLSPSDGKTR